MLMHQVATKDNTDEITEGSTNLYFTNAKSRRDVNALQTQSKMKITWHQIVQLMFLHNNLLKAIQEKQSCNKR